MDEIEQALNTLNVNPYTLYNALVKSTDDYIYLVDTAQDLALVSDNMVRDFDLPDRLVRGLVPTWGNLIHQKDQSRYYESIDQMLRGEDDKHNVEYQIKNRKQEYIWVVCRGLLTRDSDGNPQLFAGVVTQLDSKGKIDQITGLFTQLECEKTVSRLLENGKPGGILLLGLDDFTRINNLNNHLFGDAVLRQFAQSVQRFLPQDASMFRFDGDQFAVVYPGADAPSLKDLYQKIHAYTSHRNEIDGLSYYCTISAGIVQLGQDGNKYMDLIKYASSALEASKRAGKNTFTFFSPRLIETRLRSLEILNQLQLSVANDMERFSMAYQPLAHSEGLSISGAEALLRWSCDEFGAVSPSEFIPILESSGLILAVGKWVLEQAVKTCAQWVAARPDFVMNINISYLQILDATFLPFVREMLTKYAVAAEHIVLELTESYFVTDMEILKDAFHELRDINVKIAMDDFGTGYSSLGLLAQSPADIVKIDRAFISAIHNNAFNRSFISAVIQLCHSVGITVCVEGIECPEELKTVCSLSADDIQGFYISHPIPQKEFEEQFLKPVSAN